MAASSSKQGDRSYVYIGKTLKGEDMWARDNGFVNKKTGQMSSMIQVFSAAMNGHQVKLDAIDMNHAVKSLHGNIISNANKTRWMADIKNALANHPNQDPQDNPGTGPPRHSEVTPTQNKMFHHHICGGEAIADEHLGMLADAVKAACHLKRAPAEDELKDWCIYAHQQAIPVMATELFVDFVVENTIVSKEHDKARKKLAKYKLAARKRKRQERISAGKAMFEKCLAAIRRAKMEGSDILTNGLREELNLIAYGKAE